MLAKKLAPAFLVFLLVVAVTAPAFAADAPSEKIALQSIGALEAGPENVLFVADSEGAAVYALELTPPVSSGTAPPERIEAIDEKLAAMLGTTPREIDVKDMTVHEPSGTTYLSLHRGHGENAQPVLMQVARNGEISEVKLDGVPHQKLDISNAPTKDQKYGRSRMARTYTVTDLEFMNGELYIAGLSNEEFASTLRRAAYPFAGGELASTGLEIFHGAHGKFETHAPIFSFVPHTINGEPHIVAGYLCTPLVTFPLSEIKKEAKLRGKTIAELGWGNIPTDILVYGSGENENLLIVNTSRGTMRISAADVAAANARDGITEAAGPRTGVEDHTLPMGPVAQVANFDSDHIAVLGRSIDTGALYLTIMPTRRLF